MRKLITILILGLLAFATSGVQAQQTLGADETYKAFNGVAGDTLAYNSDSTAVYLSKTYFLGKKDYRYRYFVEADLKKGGSQDYVDVTLKGSNNGSKYYEVSTVRWTGTADTTIYFTNCRAESESISTTLSYKSDSTVTSTIVDETVYPTHWRYLQLYFESDSLGADMSIPTSGGPIRFRVLEE
jgi:hypothetical protein